MINNNIKIILETINQLIVLSQSEQNAFSNADSALTKAVAGAKIEAYNYAIQILQRQLEEVDG